MKTSGAADVVPALVGVVAAGVLLWALLQVDPGELNWGKAAALVFIAGFVFALVATLRYGLRGAADSPPSQSEDSQSRIRGRLALLVLAIGAVGILAVAFVVMAIFAQSGEAKPETYLGIFSSVVPVFATWVGSVIAFYFTNESYRQAALASGALQGDPTDEEPVTAPHRMIPVDKIQGLTVGSHVKPDDPTSPAVGSNPDAIPLQHVLDQLTTPVTRVIIFGKPRMPTYILRRSLMDGLKTSQTVKDYRESGKNASDSINFRFVPETATVGDARRLLKTYATVDLFVTATGSPEEPIKGWLTDTQLS